MATAQQQENMLLTEHFSWPPISLIDDIINTINEVLYRCTDTFETGISSAPPHLLGFADRYAAEKRTPEKDEDGNDVYPDAALEIEEGVLKLETLMENAVDKNFDKLEIWTLRNVLCLPRGEEELARWVRLGHYAGLDARKAEVEGEQWTPEKLYILRRKLVETQKLNAALLAEKTRNEAQIAQLRALLQPQTHQQTKRESTSPTRNGAALQNGSTFAFLTHTPAAQTLGLQPLPQTSSTAAASTTPSTGPTPLTTHTTFTTSQLPYLRQLLSNLRPHLPSTALPMGASLQHNDTATPDSASRERKLYLESQSKRILERRGVDTKEGVEGAVEGGRVRAEEVAALESVVGALGRGRERANGRGEGEVEGAVEGKGEGEAMDVS